MAVAGGISDDTVLCSIHEENDTISLQSLFAMYPDLRKIVSKLQECAAAALEATRQSNESNVRPPGPPSYSMRSNFLSILCSVYDPSPWKSAYELHVSWLNIEDENTDMGVPRCRCTRSCTSQLETSMALQECGVTKVMGNMDRVE